MTVADTDILIDALRGRQPGVGRIAQELQSGNLATTTISVFELLSGARETSALGAIQRLLAAVTILPFDESAATAAASARRQLEATGEPIGTAEYLIAGICLSRSAVLLTRNHRHFNRVPGLTLGRIEVE